MSRIRTENRDLIEGWSAPYFESVPEHLAPLPLDWLRTIYQRVAALNLSRRERFTTLSFAFHAYVLAEYFSWSCWRGAPGGPMAAKLWKRLHASRHAELRTHLEAVGLVKLVTPSRRPDANGPGEAARYEFPLLTVEATERRVGLNEGLVALSPRAELTEHFTASRARTIRAKARAEEQRPRWGTGECARAAVARCWRSFQRRRRRRELSCG